MFKAKTSFPRRQTFDLGSSPLSKNLTGHWPLNDGTGLRLYDASKKVLTTFTNGNGSGANLAAWKQDEIRGKYLFFTTAGSTNSRCSMGNTTTCDITTQSFSLSFWFNCAAGAFGSNFPGMVTKCASANTPQAGWRVFLNTSSTGLIAFEIGDTTHTQVAVQSSVRQDDSKWHLCVCYVDRRTQLMGISIDGGVFNTANCSTITGSMTNSNGIQLGVRPDGASGSVANFYIGNLSDVRFWDNRAVGQAEAQMLYLGKEFYRSVSPFIASPRGTSVTGDSALEEILLADNATMRVDGLAQEIILADNATIRVNSLVQEILTTLYTPLAPRSDRYRRVR